MSQINRISVPDQSDWCPRSIGLVSHFQRNIQFFFLNLPLEPLRSYIGLLMAKCISHAFTMSLKYIAPSLILIYRWIASILFLPFCSSPSTGYPAVSGGFGSVNFHRCFVFFLIVSFRSLDQSFPLPVLRDWIQGSQFDIQTRCGNPSLLLIWVT